jgi:hypothetical protein
VAWLDLLCFEEIRERGDWQENALANLDVFDLSSLDEMTHLPLG